MSEFGKGVSTQPPAGCWDPTGMDRRAAMWRSDICRGFSIVEVAMVAVLLAILAGITVPQIDRSLEYYRLVSSANLIASELASGQATALSRSWVYDADLDTTNHTIQIVDPDDASNSPRAAQRLEPGITFSAWPSPPIRFYSRGHARGGTITVQDSFGNALSIAVDNSGKVRIL